jgi:hypothetical protein
MDETNGKTEEDTVAVSPTSPDTTITARINALKEEKASTSSQSMTSNSTESTPVEDTTLTLESVQTICDRMFSDRMLQIEQMQDKEVQLMFEQLLNKQGSTADVSNPATETSRKLATTVENGLVILQDTRKKRQKRNDLQSPATTQIDPNTPQYKAMETDEGDKC